MTRRRRCGRSSKPKAKASTPALAPASRPAPSHGDQERGHPHEPELRRRSIGFALTKFTDSSMSATYAIYYSEYQRHACTTPDHWKLRLVAVALSSTTHRQQRAALPGSRSCWRCGAGVIHRLLGRAGSVACSHLGVSESEWNAALHDHHDCSKFPSSNLRRSRFETLEHETMTRIVATNLQYSRPPRNRTSSGHT